MAQRRMFSLYIVDTDVFLEMPASTQNLYFHLGMRADDDGFVSSPKKITAMVNCSADDLKLLLAKQFLIPFESGVCVVKDWKVNNRLQNDRCKETVYQDEKALLILEKSGAYSILDTKRTQHGHNLEPQYSIGKDSIGKVSIGESTAPPAASPAPVDGCSKKAHRKKHGQYDWVQLTDEEYSRLLNDLGEPEVKRCIAYIDESAQATRNKNKWRDWNIVLRRCHREAWGLGTAANKSGTRDTPKTSADYDSGDSFI